MFGEPAPSKTRVNERCERFQEGRGEVEDDRRPSTSTNDEHVIKSETNDQNHNHRRRWRCRRINCGSTYEMFCGCHVGLRRWLRNQGSIVPAEAFWIAKTKRSSTSAVECEGHARCVLGFQRHSAPAQGQAISEEFQPTSSTPFAWSPWLVARQFMASAPR